MTLNIEFHILQSLPPNNINRDDTGSPKTARYGGVLRARVSSQAWKRAARRDFESHLDASEVGVRTKRAVELLAERISALSPEMDTATANDLATDVLTAAGLKVKKARKAADNDAAQTEYLVFYSNTQLTKLAQIAIDAAGGTIPKAEVKAALKSSNSFDLALFGRMVADDANLNVDASCQVAHAISTHAVETESDYYTAVDDENPREDTGAGMIGTVEFNSATLYRYATISLDALQENLGDAAATAKAVEAFARSFVLSMPTGKQNTFANVTVPEAVVVMVREGRPISMVGAFENAIKPQEGGYVRGSAEALASYASDVAAAYGSVPTDVWVTRVGSATEALTALGQGVTFDALVNGLGDRVRAALSDAS